MKAAPSFDAVLSPPQVQARFADYLDLIRLRVAVLVLFTVAAGAFLAAGSALDSSLLVHVVLGTGLVAAGASALNQLLERQTDALMTRTELLLLLIGGLFVMITASVILQVGYFKATKGKRIFRMAPLQHHFELLGWAEITIVVRFWILSGLFVMAGMGVFYWEWVAGGV